MSSQLHLRAQRPSSEDDERAVYAPSPKYPLEARWRHAHGTGLYSVHVRPDGTVASVDVVTSTRAGVLDDAAIAAFRQWRFRPTGEARVVKVPVSFTLSPR
jgi:periplasmic protein TonB